MNIKTIGDGESEFDIDLAASAVTAAEKNLNKVPPPGTWYDSLTNTIYIGKLHPNPLQARLNALTDEFVRRYSDSTHNQLYIVSITDKDETLVNAWSHNETIEQMKSADDRLQELAHVILNEQSQDHLFNMQSIVDPNVEKNEYTRGYESGFRTGKEIGFHEYLDDDSIWIDGYNKGYNDARNEIEEDQDK